MNIKILLLIISYYVTIYTINDKYLTGYLLRKRDIEEKGIKNIVKRGLKKIKKEDYIINDYKKLKIGSKKGYKKYVIEVFIQKKSENKWNIVEEKIKIEGIIYNDYSIKIVSVKKMNSKDIYKYRSIDTDHQTLKNNERELITKYHYKTKEDVYENIPKCRYTGTKSIICKNVDFSGNDNIDKTQFKINLPSNYRNLGNDNLIQDKEYKNGMDCSLMSMSPVDFRKNRKSIALRCHSLYNSEYNENECKIPYK